MRSSGHRGLEELKCKCKRTDTGAYITTKCPVHRYTGLKEADILGPRPNLSISREVKKPKESTFDRWANGNQYGSFNSDED